MVVDILSSMSLLRLYLGERSGMIMSEASRHLCNRCRQRRQQCARVGSVCGSVRAVRGGGKTT